MASGAHILVVEDDPTFSSLLEEILTGEGYQVTTNTNRCLQCHGVESYRTTGAPRISPTHFMDSDGKVLAEVAPRRYFCLQCHVPQADAAPIVENTFTPSKGYGK